MTQSEANGFAERLRAQFGGHVELEEVAPGRFRFAIVSEQFRDMPRLRRQDEVWKAVNSFLSREQTLDISLIYTFAPEDVQLETKA